METWVLPVVGAVLVVVVIAGLVVARRPRSIEREFGQPREATPTEARDLAGRLSRSRNALGESLRGVFGRPILDEEFWEELQEVLVAADVGIGASTEIVDRVRQSRPADTSAARVRLRDELRAMMAGRDRELHLTGKPAVVLVVGVNGTGKTTSIAKLAKRLTDSGATALLGAADTFRAAADAQLRTWADRVGVDVVGGQEGADPAAVAYDALSAARGRGRDVVIVDTAGRLHSKKDLMAELSKIRRVIERDGDEISEVLIVLDATAGQNAVNQARQFLDATGVTGIVLSKLDGTAKGGVVIAIEQELDIPVKFIGVGEGMDDLVPFEPETFVDALLGMP